MARARNIKPGLLKNELLGTEDPLVTILFVSLWMLADREGRLEDRPLRIKAETFPYRENIDVNGYLTVLQRLGFIHRYEVNGLRLIQVDNFEKHQAPHKTEKPSTLPSIEKRTDKNPIESDSCSLTVKEPLSNGEITEPLPPDSLIHGFTDSLIPDCPDFAKITPQAAPPKQRATRLPSDWQLTPEFIDAALELKPLLDQQRLQTIANTFRDYWVAKSGKDAAKLDWLATWRNWVRREPDGPPRSPDPPKPFLTAREKNAQRNADIFNLAKARDF